MSLRAHVRETKTARRGKRKHPRESTKKGVRCVESVAVWVRGLNGMQWSFFSPFPLPACRRSPEAEVERNSAKPSRRLHERRSETRTHSSSGIEHRNEPCTAGGEILFIMAIFTYGERLYCAHNTQNTYMARGRVGRKCITTRPTFECCFFFYRALVLRRE